MKKVSEMNGLEFRQLLHDVMERLENENHEVVEIQRPNASYNYIVIDNDSGSISDQCIGSDRLLNVHTAEITSEVKLY